MEKGDRTMRNMQTNGIHSFFFVMVKMFAKYVPSLIWVVFCLKMLYDGCIPEESKLNSINIYGMVSAQPLCIFLSEIISKYVKRNFFPALRHTKTSMNCST